MPDVFKMLHYTNAGELVDENDPRADYQINPNDPNRNLIIEANKSIPPKPMGAAESLARAEALAAKSSPAKAEDVTLESIVGQAAAAKLAEAGINSLEEARAFSDEELEAIDGIGKATVSKIRA